MSDFDDMMDEANADLLTAFGDTVSYTVYGSAAKSITAVFANESVRQEEDHDGKVIVHLAELSFERDATDGIADATTRDTVAIDGNTWHVVEILEQSVTWTKVSIVRRETLEKTREGYRLQRS